VKTQNVWIEQAGCRWVRRGGSYEVLRALLRRGEVCWMNWDVGGHTVHPVRLLGRTIHVGGGPARLALETGACVVPAFVWREADAQVAVLFEAVDPRAVSDESELDSLVASAVEAALGPRLAQAQRGFAHRHDWRSPRDPAGRPDG
jgi:lauroyl/myristoyl acyltransferase